MRNASLTFYNVHVSIFKKKIFFLRFATHLDLLLGFRVEWESVSSSNVLVSSDAEDDANDASLTGCTNMTHAHIDELAEYLALPQIENNGEW